MVPDAIYQHFAAEKLVGVDLNLGQQQSLRIVAGHLPDGPRLDDYFEKIFSMDCYPYVQIVNVFVSKTCQIFKKTVITYLLDVKLQNTFKRFL